MVDPVFLQPNEFVDSYHTEIVRFAREHAGDLEPLEAAIHLCKVVRERLRYNPWRVRFEREAYRASSVLARPVEEGGHCIDKALLLAGLCRALGIPSRLHFANVRNHIVVEGSPWLAACMSTRSPVTSPVVKVQA